MDRVFSARVDETIIQRIGSLARRLRTSQKRIIEDAVLNYADKLDLEEKFDAFEQTCGAWHRKEPAEQVVKEARKEFRKSMERYRK